MCISVSSKQSPDLVHCSIQSQNVIVHLWIFISINVITNSTKPRKKLQNFCRFDVVESGIWHYYYSST